MKWASEWVREAAHGLVQGSQPPSLIVDVLIPSFFSFTLLQAFQTSACLLSLVLLSLADPLEAFPVLYTQSQ